MTPLEEQVKKHKAAHPGVLLLIEVGYKVGFSQQSKPHHPPRTDPLLLSAKPSHDVASTCQLCGVTDCLNDSCCVFDDYYSCVA